MRKLSTAVPIRDMEREATPSGPVVTYQMSEEELRNMRKKLVHKSGMRDAYRLGIKTACETLGHDFGWL